MRGHIPCTVQLDILLQRCTCASPASSLSPLVVVEQVVRRLRRLCRQYGSNPTFVVASATIANPGQHAQLLLGMDKVSSPHLKQHIPSRVQWLPQRWLQQRLECCIHLSLFLFTARCSTGDGGGR